MSKPIVPWNGAAPIRNTPAFRKPIVERVVKRIYLSPEKRAEMRGPTDTAIKYAIRLLNQQARGEPMRLRR